MAAKRRSFGTGHDFLSWRSPGKAALCLFRLTQLSYTGYISQ